MSRPPRPRPPRSRTTRRRLDARFAVLAPVLAVVLAVGCGRDAPTTAPFARLALHAPAASGNGPEHSVRPVGHIAPELGAWSASGEDPAPSAVSGRRGEPVLQIAFAQGDAARPARLVHTLASAPEPRASVQRVLVMARASGGIARLRVALEHADGRQTTSAAQSVWPESELRPFVFDFPELTAEPEPPRRVIVTVAPGSTAFDLGPVELLAVPLAAWLPPPRAARETGAPRDPARGSELVPGDLIEVGVERRRGVGLTSAVPLAAALPDVGVDAVLTFAWVVPSGLGPARGDAWLEVALAIDGERRVQRLPWSARAAADEEPANPNERHDAPQPPRWRFERLPLADLGTADGAQVERVERGPARLELALVASGGEPIAAAVAELALRPAQERNAASHPTVLLVTSDTHRADHVSSAPRAAAVATPTLDALAADGLLYERAFAASNVTNPSHASLLTGLHLREHGIFNNGVALPDVDTLAERFASAGYTTWAVTSAYHLRPDHSGLGQGFDRFGAPDRAHRTARETLATLERWLSEDPGGPLFVWLHLFDAHGPYDPPEPHRSRHAPLEPDPYDPELPLPAELERFVPPYLEGLRDLEHVAGLYRGEVAYLDAELGDLLAHQRFQDAIVAFTSDHGESLGQHGIWFEHEGLYPDTVQVPLILRYPGARDAGRAGVRVSRNVTNVDLGRTLLSLAGLAAPGFPGRTLVPPDGPAEPPPEPVYTIGSFRRNASITAGRWHLILTIVPHHSPNVEQPFERHATELYDLDRDPGAEHDLAALERERARGLRNQLIEWLHDAREGWSFDAQVDPALSAALEALGYVDAGRTTIEGTFAEALPLDCSCAACAAFR